MAGLAIPPTGPNALFNQPGIASRRRNKKRKKCTCELTTKAAGAPGEKIAPGITRIRGNLCNVHGRYGPCDKGGAGKKPKGGAPKKPKKIAQAPDEKRAARAQEQAQNRNTVFQSLNIAPDGQAALEALRSGAQPDEQAIERGGFAQAGLVEQAQDGSYRLTSSGRAILSAASAGDAGRAGDTISGARDRTSARTGRETARAVRQQETATRRAQTQANRAQARAAKPAKVGGDSDKKKPANATPKRAARRAGRARGSSTAGAQSSAKPKKPATPKLAKPQITPELQSAARALSEGADVTDAQIQQLVTNGLVKLNTDGDPVLTAAGQRATMKDAHLFTVYKDSAGADRWLAITTTAYQDKDHEIISTNAIKESVLLGDKMGERGPLLYWHVPGLPMGDCDFQAQGGPGGRFLIEGGTFRSKAMALLGQTLSASGYQMSPGFIHSDDEPQNGVYDHILIYERSAVPEHRAANYFTRYATAKEDKVLPPEKIAEYREKAAGNPEALALLDTLLATTAKEDATAQARNVVFKETAEMPHEIEIGGVVYTIKAFPPAAAETVADEEEVVTEEADDGMQMESEDAGMDDAAFAQLLAQAVVQAITPLLDIEKKMGVHMADLKSALGGYAQQKDDATAAQAAQIAALDAKLKELTGDLPESVMQRAGGLYRASESPLTKLTTEGESKVKEIVQQIPAGLTDPNEIAAYQLIFGNT